MQLAKELCLPFSVQLRLLYTYYKQQMILGMLQKCLFIFFIYVCHFNNEISNAVEIKIYHPVLDSSRVGSALIKKDAHHRFSDIVDNYARYAKTFDLLDADTVNKGWIKKLYQVEGSLDGFEDIFEWIVENRLGKGTAVSHRLFIKHGKITGIVNMHVRK